MNEQLHAATLKLLAYCEANDWAGYEPYDALNSRVLARVPLSKSRLWRIAVTQALKRSPINVRRLLLIPPTQNPKALGLFLSALVKLERSSGQIQKISNIVGQLVALRSQGVPYWCWGYNFPWQTRTVLVPRWNPNLVCTAFAAEGLLDAYDQNHEAEYLTMAVSAAEFILNELYFAEGDSIAGFGYPLPSVRNQVHNANFLGAGLLCRVYKHTGNAKFLAPAFRAARHSAAQQRADGSWLYGEASSQRWIDNFHTGFNLCALQNISRYAGTSEFESHIQRGLDFYRAHFFLPDGVTKYYHNRTYPIDAHCIAQSIITLVALRDLDPDNVRLAQRIFQWALDHLWDERGFFYYRVLRSCTIRTSYMRWTQAWMLLAMSMLLTEAGQVKEKAAEAVPAAFVRSPA